MRNPYLLYLLAATCCLMYFSPTQAACNQGNHFDEDLVECFNSSADIVSLTRERLSKALGGGGTSPYLDNIISDYKTFFPGQNRAAPVSEIDLCGTVELASELDKVLQTFPK